MVEETSTNVQVVTFMQIGEKNNVPDLRLGSPPEPLQTALKKAQIANELYGGGTFIEEPGRPATIRFGNEITDKRIQNPQEIARIISGN